MLVVAHVYYPEVWFDIEDRLVRIPEPYDLVVSLVEGRTEVLEPEIATRLPQAMIHRVPNLGRDLGSLVELAGAGVFDGYDAILKVHTKRSPHRIDGDAWRVALLDALMPSPEGIRRIVELLRSDRSVGLVVPTGHACAARRPGARTRSSSRRSQREFPSPSIRTCCATRPARCIWARPWVLRRLADLRLGREHFEPEASHVDGSTAHALERFVGVATATHPGLDVVDDRRRLVAAAPRAAEADPAAQGARLLPPSVPSDPGERRLVGNRVHRLGERRPRPARLRGAPAAGRSRESSAGTTCRIPR